MTTAEIYSRLNPKSQRWSIGFSGGEALRPEDLLLAMQGCKPEHQAYILFIYGGDPQSRHSFYAGLFMEAMAHPDVQAWKNARKQHGGYYRQIEAMVLLAVIELSGCHNQEGMPAGRLTNEARARFMGVSRSTWGRKYRDIYQTIVAMPPAWEALVMRKVNKRLR